MTHLLIDELSSNTILKTRMTNSMAETANKKTYFLQHFKIQKHSVELGDVLGSKVL